MSDGPEYVTFSKERVAELLDGLERLAARNTETNLPISPAHDELDAIAFGVNVLVDELRWAYARLTESERVNFATAFHANPCAMAIVRVSDGCFQDVNAGFERQTGFSRDEVVGRTVHELGLGIEPDDRDGFVGEMGRSGRVGSREVRFHTRSGATAAAICSADVITFHGESCILGAALDITDRRNAEAQAASLRDELAHLGRVTILDALTGSLAHEINQPLTAVMANTEAALQITSMKPLPLGDLRETLEDVLNDSRRAGDVVWRTRAMLKKEVSPYEPVDVNGAVAEVVKLVRGNAIGRRIALDVDLASHVRPVDGDRVQVQQVILNLLMNAFDAVQDCGPDDRRVTVRTSVLDSKAVIDVSDRGVGLSDDGFAAIFEPFSTTKRDGLGLGLWICRGIVAAHGGTLDATRNPDGGMTFSAMFPLGRSHEAGRSTAATGRLQEL